MSQPAQTPVIVKEAVWFRHRLKLALMLMLFTVGFVISAVSYGQQPAGGTIWIAMTTRPGNNMPITAFGRFAEDTVKSRLQLIPHVFAVNTFGAETRMEILLDLELLSLQQRSVEDVLEVLQQFGLSVQAVPENAELLAMQLDPVRHQYDGLADFILWIDDDGNVVTMSDVATFQTSAIDPIPTVGGEPAIVLTVVPQADADLMRLNGAIEATIVEINTDGIPRGTIDLRIVEETAINLN